MDRAKCLRPWTKAGLLAAICLLAGCKKKVYHSTRSAQLQLVSNGFALTLRGDEATLSHKTDLWSFRIRLLDAHRQLVPNRARRNLVGGQPLFQLAGNTGSNGLDNPKADLKLETGRVVITGNVALSFARGQFTLKTEDGTFAPGEHAHIKLRSIAKIGSQPWQLRGVELLDCYIGHDTIEVYAPLGATFDVSAAPAHGAAPDPIQPASVWLDVRDGNGEPIRARVLIESYPTIAPVEPGKFIVFDPTRHAEKTTPIVDVTDLSAPTRLQLPAGRYIFRATAGLTHSLARRELFVSGGDRVRVDLRLVREVETPGFVGCDFHVHAERSMDARDVTYEDRVRSLTAVGVECAAATEHDHVGDYEPALARLGLREQLRALPGVELTTQNPGFGHFNVYPWPSRSGGFFDVPVTRATSPRALFAAIHALPQPVVLQVNHARLRTGTGFAIGYFDLVSPVLPYQSDYDAIEIYNGYEVENLDHVRGNISEWIGMLDRGERHVATGSSDSHKIWYPWAGFPRTLVEVGANWWAENRPISTLTRAVLDGKAVVTAGPFVQVDVDGVGLGKTIRLTNTGVFHIQVQLPSWLSSPTVQLFVGVKQFAVPLTKSRTGTYTGEFPVPVPVRPQSVVALVEATPSQDAMILFLAKQSIAVTNPIWIAP